jgi:uncharacterized secreted protein with C-terminal beta-propeller domain
VKKNDIYEEIGNISPDLIAEADPTAARAAKRKKRLVRALSAIAACFSIMIISVSVWLFKPYEVEIPENILAQSDTPFYDVYIKAYEYANRGQHKNNYEKYVYPKLFTYLRELHKDEIPRFGELMEGSSSNTPSPSLSGNYVEVTDNQIDGIVEPDLFKRTDTHLFYRAEKCIYSYTIDGENSKLCGVFSDFGNASASKKYRPREMFLTEDGNTLIVIAVQNKVGTEIVFIDVSDPCNMRAKARIRFDSRYSESRMKDGFIYISSKSTVDINQYSGYENTYHISPAKIEVIKYGCGPRSEKFSREEVFMTENAGEQKYLILLQIDVEKIEIKNKLALFSFDDDVFAMFEDRIILGREYEENESKIIDTYPSRITRRRTEFAVISYGEDGFEVQGSIDVEGYLVNQYAADLDGDILRLVVTSGKEVRNSITYEWQLEDIRCDLLCYDISSGKRIAAVKSFAPEDEEVKSVRFDGDVAYVCTAKMEVTEGGAVIFSDPVYFFDLSNYKKITSIDTGTIEGYSSSLKPFGNGLLLGIGYGNEPEEGYGFTLKVEIYAEKDGKVESLCSFERQNVHFATSYKSYLIDCESGYIGIAFDDCNIKRRNERYILLRYDGEKITQIVEVSLNDVGSVNNARSVVIDGYLYLMYEEDFQVIK